MIFIVLVFSDRTQLVSAREDTAGVRMAGHRDTTSPMMGQKCPIKKTPRDKDDRSFRTPSKKLRQKEIQEIDKKASKEHQRQRRTVTSLRHTQRAGNALESL